MDDLPRAHEELLRTPARSTELVTIPQALDRMLSDGLRRYHQSERKELGTVEVYAETFARGIHTLWPERTGRNVPVPVPVLRNNVTAALVDDVALRLGTGINFLRMSKDAGWMETPILLYYGLMQVIGGVTRAIFEWENPDLRQHGIHQRAAEQVGDVKVMARGAFPRTMTFLTIVTMVPSAFERVWIPASGRPVATTESLQTTWSLNELLNMSPADVTVRQLHLSGIGENIHLPIATRRTMIARDLLIAFLASSWARYHPSRWAERQQTLDRVVIEDTFERCRGSLEGWLRFLPGPTGKSGPFDYHAPSGQVTTAWEQITGTPRTRM